METEYEVMTVSPADRMISSAYSATIRGRQDIDIYPQVSGTLTKVCVTEGQRKERYCHSSALKLLCRRQWQTLNRSQFLATAQLTYDSKEELYKENVISSFDLSTAKTPRWLPKHSWHINKAQEVSARNNLLIRL